MALNEDILELLLKRGIKPARHIRIALSELLAIIGAENPDLPPPDNASEDAGDDDAGLAVRTIECPHCGENVVVELELDGGDQEIIQDCSVCCRPISISWHVSAGQLTGLESGPG